MTTNTLNHTVHFDLQSKGGAGKSVIAYLMAQYLQSKGDAVFFDTDPSNKTLTSFKSLEVQAIDVMKADEEVVDQSAFDNLIEGMLSTEAACLVDTGSGDFLPISSYLKTNGVIDILAEEKKQVFIHVVINGGQAQLETFKCLNLILENYNAPVVVWENQYFGKLVDAKGATTSFTDAKLYKEHQGKIVGHVVLEKLNADTFEKDFKLMMNNCLTFADVENDKAFTFMQRNRLKRLKSAFFEQLDEIFNVTDSKAAEDK